MNGKTAEEILCDKIEIKSPGILLGIVGDLKLLIKSGILKQIEGNVSIERLPEKPPFEQDVIQMVFESVPGKSRYELICETYHGQGGVFRKV